MMKKFQILSLMAGLFAVLPLNTAYAQTEDEIDKEQAAEDTVPAPISDEAKQVVEGLNTFSLDIYKATLEAGKNHFISPASVSTAFGLAYGGAAGATADEIRTVLRYPFARDQFAKANGGLLETMSLDRKGRKLSVNNALWAADDFEMHAPYVAQMDQYYGAAVRRIDYANPDAAVKKINGWVESKTNDRIKNLLSPTDVDTDTRSVLVNTVYFKADWYNVFAKAKTEDRPFKLSSGKKIVTPLMTRQNGFRLLEKKGMQVISLPYRGREMEMVVFLPKSHGGLAKFEKNLTPEMLKQSIAELKQAPIPQVILTFPKFKLEAKLKLSVTLAKMGMPTPFSDKANFSGMADEPLKLDQVIHQTFLEVDEKGTEAAAATAITVVTVTGTRGPPPKPKVFNADHPFFFLIRDKRTGAILFMGRYVEPEASAS